LFHVHLLSAAHFDALSWPRMEIQEQDLDLPQTLYDIKTYPCGCMPDCDLFEYPTEPSFAFLDPDIHYYNGILLRNPK